MKEKLDLIIAFFREWYGLANDNAIVTVVGLYIVLKVAGIV